MAGVFQAPGLLKSDCLIQLPIQNLEVSRRALARFTYPFLGGTRWTPGSCFMPRLARTYRPHVLSMHVILHFAAGMMLVMYTGPAGRQIQNTLMV